MLLAGVFESEVAERLAAELAEVETRFAAELVSDLACVNDLVGHVERYRGKMLRPMLVLVSGMAAAPAAGRRGAKPQPKPSDNGDKAAGLTEGHRVIATVVEMVHMATLVHDDILDEAEVRRRGTTVNARSGNEAAVMLGDYLISHSYHLCSTVDQPLIARAIAETTNTVCEGELLQLANRNNWDLDEATYFEIIRRKTASLTGGCCRLGAMLHGGVGEEVGDAFYEYGEKLGAAFQVVDDLLDLEGEETTVGKSLGRDLAKGKLTLPLIHYLKTVDAVKRRHMLTLIKSIGTETIADVVNLASITEVRGLVTGSESMGYARAAAHRLVEQAKAAVEPLPESPAKGLLMEMADAVLTRKS
jgi:octaprenyl-diphosphate synthase